MNKIITCLFAIFFISLVNCTWKEVFTLTCEGKIHTVGDNGLLSTAFDFSKQLKIASAIFDEYKHRVKCVCPNLKDENFDKYFVPYSPLFLFRLLNGENFTSIPDCDHTLFNYPFNFTNTVNFVLPESCTEETWNNGKGCLAQADWFDSIGAKANIAFQKCPGSSIPYVSVLCDGAGCDALVRPCSTSNDKCGAGYKCSGISFLNFTTNATSFLPTDSQVFEALKTLFIYGQNDTNQCYKPQTLMTNIYDFVTKFFDASYSFTIPQTRLELCVPDKIQLDDNFGSSIVDLLKFNNCIIESYQHCEDRYCQQFNFTTGKYEDILCGTSCYTRTTKIDCVANAFLKKWDGKTSDNRNALAANRLDGTYFKSPATSVNKLGDDDEVIFAYDCKGGAYFSPGGVFGVNVLVPGLPLSVEMLLKEIKNIVKCRSIDAEIAFNEEIFNIRYGLEGLLYYLTNPVTKKSEVVNTFSDWTGSLSQMSSKVNMPSTCTYSHFLLNGYCAAQYVGLKSLLGLDLTMRTRLRKCPSGFVELYVGCKGTDCKYLNNYQLCNADSECTATTKCSNVLNENDLAYNNTNCYYNGIDTVCNTYPDPLYFGLFKKDNTCYRNFTFELKKDLHNILYSVKGGQKDYTGTSTTGICFADRAIIENLNFTEWAQGQVSVDSNLITLKDLQKWDVGSADIGTSDARTESSSAINLLVSLAIMIIAMLI